MVSESGSSSEQAAVHGLSGDRPKEELKEDRLGYSNFSETLARTIATMAPNEGIVLALHGVWGSGKTSAVNMMLDALVDIERQMDVKETTLVVRFNPWWFSEQQDLTRAFFSEVSAALSTKVSDAVAKGLKRIGKHVAGAKDLILAGLELAPGGAILKPLAEKGIDAFADSADEDVSLDQERKKLVQALRSEGRRILVIVDDIDRLQGDEARQIFKLVKSVADLPSIIYLLVFDRTVAKAAIGDSGAEFGPDWLDKIVQASFDLPPVHSVDLHRLVFEGINRIIGDYEPPDEIRWGNVFHDAVAPWLRTPRDVGRLLNGIAVAWSAVGSEVDFADFVAIETIRVFEPQLYDLIRQNPGKVTGVPDGEEENDKSFGDKLVASLKKVDAEDGKDALMRLFPRLESIWDNRYYADGFSANWAKSRRVCSKEHFITYFSFGPSDEVLASVELAEFLSDLRDLVALDRRVRIAANTKRRSGGTKAAVLLSELRARSDEIPDEHLTESAANLLVVADLFLTDLDEGRLGVPQLWQISWALMPLLNRLPQSARANVLRQAIEKSPSLESVSYLFHQARKQHEEGEGQRTSKRLLTSDEVDKLKASMVGRLRSGAATNKLLNLRNPLPLLYAWIDFCGAEEVQQWFAEQLAHDDRVLLLAKHFTGTARTQSSGDRVVSKVPTVQRSKIEELVDFDAFVQRLDELDAIRTDQEARGIIERFRKGLKIDSDDEDE